MMRTGSLAIGLLLLVSTESLAGPASLTSEHDMQLPADSVAACNGPLCLAYNPAGLHWSAPGEFVYLHDEHWGPGDLAAGGADGLLYASDRFGLGIQYLRPASGQAERDLIKYSLAVKLFSLGRHFALAGGLEILDPTETAEDPSLDYLVAAMVRPWRHVSLGVVGRNLASARIGQQQAHRSLDLGLSVRPLWFAPESLTLSADYRFCEDQDDPALRLTVQASIFEGIGLLGTVDLDGHFGVGFAVDFLRFGAGGYTHFANRDGIRNEGMVLFARASLVNKPGLNLTTGRTAEIVLRSDLVDTDQPPRGLFTRRTSLYDVELAIRHAAVDERIDSLLLKVESIEMGMTRVQSLRAAIAEFKRGGKKVAFHLESANNLTYYLASAADAIFLDPAGSVGVTGPRVEALFFGGTLDMIGVSAEANRAGRYKTAVEMFTNQEPSPAYLEVLNSLADETADQVFSAIADGRGLARDQVEILVDQGLMPPAQAEEAGLIDGVAHYDELEEPLQALLGHPVQRMSGYLGERWFRQRWGGLPSVAVVHATGGISYGEQALPTGMNARSIAKTLKSLRTDSSVDAVVLRIDSPGGSGLASELIWREVFLLRKTKPVIVSMGAVAASGGYYIACPADWILAEPATITGSIGVFALMFDASELWARLGVSREAVGRGKLSDLYTSFRGRSPDERDLLQRVVDEFYKGFVQRVADGRRLDPAEVEPLAQGRVWTGRQAQKNGLIDELGGLHRAIELAKERIGLDREEAVQVIHLPRQGLGLKALMVDLGLVQDEASLLPRLLRTSMAQLVQLASLSSEPVLALLPYWTLTVK
jgi:protease-4